MKKILTIFFLLVVSAALDFGQAAILQFQQEWQQFYLECNNSLVRFYRASTLN